MRENSLPGSVLKRSALVTSARSAMAGRTH
jgi:hypothetical protein